MRAEQTTAVLRPSLVLIYKYRVSNVVGPWQVELGTFFWKNCIISVPSRPPSRPCFFSGIFEFVLEARRCALFDAYATLSLWKDLDAVVCMKCTLVNCCMSEVLKGCGLFVLVQSAGE